MHPSIIKMKLFSVISYKFKGEDKEYFISGWDIEEFMNSETPLSQVVETIPYTQKIEVTISKAYFNDGVEAADIPVTDKELDAIAVYIEEFVEKGYIDIYDVITMDVWGTQEV